MPLLFFVLTDMGRAGENGLVASKSFQKKGRKTIFVFIWPGVGIVLIALIGFFVFKQHLDLAAVIGLALIIAGVVVINVFSNSVSHWRACTGFFYKWLLLGFNL